MAATVYQNGATGILSTQVVSPARASLPANTMNCHAIVAITPATASAASASSARPARAPKTDAATRIVMFARSINATGMQQATATATINAPASRTPSIGRLASQRARPSASVIAASAISATSPTTESARVSARPTRSSR